LDIPAEYLNAKTAEQFESSKEAASEQNDFGPFELEKHDKISESEDDFNTQPCKCNCFFIAGFNINFSLLLKT
jgi:hypothetical protein